MQALKLLVALLVFCVFWFISTPVYGLAHLCDYCDRRLSDLLERLFDFWS